MPSVDAKSLPTASNLPSSAVPSLVASTVIVPSNAKLMPDLRKIGEAAARAHIRCDRAPHGVEKIPESRIAEQRSGDLRGRIVAAKFLQPGDKRVVGLGEIVDRLASCPPRRS